MHVTAAADRHANVPEYCRCHEPQTHACGAGFLAIADCTQLLKTAQPKTLKKTHFIILNRLRPDPSAKRALKAVLLPDRGLRMAARLLIDSRDQFDLYTLCKLFH